MRLLILSSVLFSSLFFADDDTDRKVSELSVAELKQIVRMIVEESIEQCTVSGTMEGRAKLNLAVEGEVVARMTCEFKS